MANPIRRLVQLILDRAAAKRTEKEARAALGGIESALGTLKRAALAVGGALAAAFGVRALIRFGKESLQQALESEKAWSELQGTIDATGDSFNSMEADLRALGAAFQDITAHSDEDYATSLARLITLTGDVTASTNNMGLVANVAAQFFGGELGPAVELVSKVMNGNITILQRMGIHVKTAQEGLELLATRSFGAAQRQAGTFGGQLKKLNILWDDFKEEVGGALIASGQQAGALDTLSAAVKTLIKWVKDNKDEIREWVTNGINVAIGAIQTLIGFTRTLLQMRGKLSLTAGARPVQLSDDPKALAAQIAGFAKQRADALNQVNRLQDELTKAEAGRKFSAFGNPRQFAESQKHMDALKLDLQEAVDLLAQIDDNAADAQIKLNSLGTTKPPPSLFGAKPQLGKNATSDEAKAIEDAQKKFDQAMKAAAGNARLLGAQFDELGAEGNALQDIITALLANGIAPTDKRLVGFAKRLSEIKLSQVVEELGQDMKEIQTHSAEVGGGFDAVGAEAAALEKALGSLARLGFDETDDRARAYAKRLKEITGISFDFQQAADTQRAVQAALGMQFNELGQQISGATDAEGNFLDAAGNVIDPMAALNSEASALSQAIAELAAQQIRTTGVFDAADPVMAGYIKRLKEIQRVQNETAKATKRAQEIAGAFGDALQGVIEGNVGAVAAAKAKEDLIQAAEYGVEALVSSLNPFTAYKVGPLLAAAQTKLALAAAWGALAAATGGFSGGGGPSAGGGGGGMSGATGATAAASQRSEPAQQEVHIHLVGPGFDAMNVEVQRVVFGAEQLARQRFGKNAKVRIRKGP